MPVENDYAGSIAQRWSKIQQAEFPGRAALENGARLSYQRR